MLRSLLLAALLTAASAVPALAAAVITFETTPVGAPSIDDAPLGLAAGYAVGPITITFGFDTDLNGVAETPGVFEHTGTEAVDAFFACNGKDTPATGFAGQMGDFFLRGNPFANFGRLIIHYSGGTATAASGEIWDIDAIGPATEQYRVRAFDGSGTLLATIDSPIGNQDSGCANTQLDGKSWTFAFSGLLPGIANITIEFIGSKTNNIGLAFNNYNATGEEPVPALQHSWGRVKQLYR